MIEKDYFESQIGQILCPLSDLKKGVLDTTYMMRTDGSFVYVEGYYQPPGKVIGKIIYYPKPGGKIDIHGRAYESMVKAEKDGKTLYIPHDEQIRVHYENDPSLDREDLIITKFHVGFPLSGFRGYFNDRLSLYYAMGKFPLVGRAVENVSRFLNVPISRLGITGSTALGRRGEHSDIDLVIFGTIEQNRETADRICDHIHRNPESKVVEFGKFWPLRFIYQGIELCPAYVYMDLGEVPIRDCTITKLKDAVEVFGTVSDATHAIYMPPVARLSDVYIDGKPADDITLVVYDGSVRGEFYLKERLRIKGRLIKVKKGKTEFSAVTVFDAGDIAREQLS
ncbi:MAG: nucleotidyltransferase domain-containing protein [Candidatus Aureabacteria bacterium]|nr:nucleotidyltransferase domain-containing protein [Candidatus Auribacterota bacterium]